MDNIALRFVYDRKNETGIKGRKPGHKYTDIALLQIEVKQVGQPKRIFISTGVRISPNQFDEKNGFTCKNHPNASAITAKAHRIFRQIEAFCLTDVCQTLDDVKKWDVDESITTSVVEFIKADLRRRDSSFSVVEYNNSFIKRLEEYGKIKAFSDATYENLLGFDEHLRKTIKSQPTLYKRHNLFKSYINEAIKRGLCKSNPYDLFKLVKGKDSPKEALTETEVQRLLNYSPKTDKLQKAKDLFIFQCFTGLAYIDMMNFDKTWVRDEDGVKVIRSSRSKTDESFISILLPEADEIAIWYDYKLPKISNQKYNDYIKILAEAIGITKNLTSHVARHSIHSYHLQTSTLQNSFYQ